MAWISHEIAVCGGTLVVHERPAARRSETPPLVLLHGFTGNGRTWDQVADALPDRRILAPDLPGHGDSRFADEVAACAFDTAVAALDDALGTLDAPSFDLAGYSMGGRLALFFALERPARVARLVLESASAGLATAAARAARRDADAALARFAIEYGIEAFVARWERTPVLSAEQRLPDVVRSTRRAQRLGCRAEGLAASLLGMGTGSQPWLGDRLGELAMPVLLVAGAEDEKFRRIAEELRRELRDARLHVVPSAGHDVHLAAPRTFAELLHEFTERSATAEDTTLHHTGRAIRSKNNAEDPRMDWQTVKQYEDITYKKAEGIARIAIDRPQVHNAFRPQTVVELIDAFAHVREERDVGVVILTGEGGRAFCSGGDQSVRGEQGYVGDDGVPRLNVLDLQKMIRSLPKPVVAMVAGWAIGGGHVLHVVCDLTIAADNARFGQTGPKVGSFDGGFGASYLARNVGQKKAREIWYLCRQYDAQQALTMGLVNEVVPLDELEATTIAWCREMLRHSPMALRCLKSAFNAETDGMAGIQELAGNATLLFYMTEEAQEGRNAFNAKRAPEFERFPRLP